MKRFLQTDDSWILLAQRFLLAAVIFPHGAQKLLGWFGGYGFSGTMGFFTNTMQIPALFAFLVILAESFGAIGLALGLFSRLSALGISLVMLGAIFMTHLPNGFFMNWYGQQAGEGFEYHLLVLALSIPILIKGGGLWAADSWLLSRLSSKRRVLAQAQIETPNRSTHQEKIPTFFITITRRARRP